jgi:thioesterase domain-containing protein
LLPSFAFDSSVAVVFHALIGGGTLCLSTDEQSRDPDLIGRLIAEWRITHLLCVPTLYRQLLDLRLPVFHDLECVIVAGESCPPALVTEHLQKQPQTSLFNEYGPTECTVWSSVHSCRNEDGPHSVPIGRPIANTRVYVLDERMQPLPIGIPGELYIGGAGVCRGYWRRPDLTAAKFVRDPFSTEVGARLYRTGDRARWRADGDLEFLGRLDDQIKLRGFRIERGEIEATLGEHPQIRQAVVQLREDRAGDQRLVAYVVPRGGPVVVPTDLRGFLRRKLPEYMVPSAIVVLDALPLTPNGKVDRSALPAPAQTESVGRTHRVAPRDETESRVLKLWEEILGAKGAGVTEDFFEQGGNSLLALSLLTRIEREFDRKISLPTFISSPTIQDVAINLREEKWVDPDTQVFPLRREGTRPPLLLIGAGSIHRPLVRRLGPDQPVFGIELPKLSDLPERFTVKDIAAQLVDALCDSHIEAPYRLAGWSHAGLIAYEMAQQLHSRGKDIALLVLFDTGNPAYLRSFRGWRNCPKQLYIMLEKWLYYFRKVCSMPLRNAWQQFRERRRRFELRFQVLTFSWQMQYCAAANYEPKPCDWPLVLFRSTALQTGWFRDLELGWRKLARAGLQVHEMPGEHDTMFLEPDVQRLASKLGECL